MSQLRAVFFDLDGTLVDSNRFHVDAWVQAFAEAGHAVDADRIAGQIGKGVDNLVPALVPGADADTADAFGEAHGRIFKNRYLDRVRPFTQARALVERVHASGHQVALASSASKEELEHYCQLLDIGGLVDVTTTIDDVGTSKPAPDIFAVALEKVGLGAHAVIVVGDSPFDIAGAQQAGIAAVAVRSGGFSDDALADAVAIYDDAAALLADYDRSPLGRR